MLRELIESNLTNSRRTGGIHIDEPGDGLLSCGAILQQEILEQERYGRAVDQGRQAGGGARRTPELAVRRDK